MGKKKIQRKNLKKLPFKRKYFFNSIITKNSFGSAALLAFRQFRVERIYLRILKKIIKKKYKKKRNLRIYGKCWIRFHPNLFLTKKSKNSRMGSGRGSFVRTAFLLKKNKSLLEFKGHTNRYIVALKNKFKYKLPFFLFLKIYKLNFFN